MEFTFAFKKLMQWEGRESDDPNDTGGHTILGVSRKHHPDMHAKLVGKTYQEQMRLVKPWYKTEFWDMAHCDLAPSPVGIVMFEAAVHSGPLRSIRWLQKAAGTKADGILGPKSRQAIARKHPIALMMEFNIQRIDSLADFETWPHHKIGWLRRLMDIQYSAQTYYLANNTFSTARLL